MAQRRFHTKSRRGCRQCKKNRTKCDETKPSCGRCKRIGSECSLADETSDWLFVTARPKNNRDVQTAAETSRGTLKPSILSYLHYISAPDYLSLIVGSSPAKAEQSVVGSYLTDVERDRLRLISHYTLRTSKTLAEITTSEEEDPHIWSDWVTELAFEHDFLLHGLLSLSALHLALCGVSRKKHFVAAIHHHGLAVALFRTQLANISEDNYNAIVAFSCIVAFYSFGIQRSSETEGDPIMKLYQVLNLVRGTAFIIKFSHESLARSRWSRLLLHVAFQSKPRLPDPIEDVMTKLMLRASAVTLTKVEMEMYTQAIEELRANLCVAITHPHTQMTITLFPIMSPLEFWNKVASSEPLALAILANYAVALYWLRGNVWMAGWGKQTIDAVHQALPLDWHDCIAWATREAERS